jgi:nucleoside-diphosphate kinase
MIYRFKLAAIKLVTPGKEHLEAHYADLADKPFFPGWVSIICCSLGPWADILFRLITYMNSGPICAMVWEGREVVKTGRGMNLILSIDAMIVN